MPPETLIPLLEEVPLEFAHPVLLDQDSAPVGLEIDLCELDVLPKSLELPCDLVDRASRNESRYGTVNRNLKAIGTQVPHLAFGMGSAEIGDDPPRLDRQPCFIEVRHVAQTDTSGNSPVG